MEPIRSILRHKKASVKYYEAEATKIDYANRVVHVSGESEVSKLTKTTEVPFDMLVVGVGAENATFGQFPQIYPTYPRAQFPRAKGAKKKNPPPKANISV